MTSPTDSAPRPESAVPPSDDATNPAPPEDELPEWEPLTPELVEDEAVRGDAMLRNAVLLLALLVGWTQIADTSLLVRIKSGQFMAQHGVLPPRTDPFAMTTEGREWVNLGWLSDLALAATYKIGYTAGIAFGSDGKALTLWGALAGLLTFWLVSRTSLKKLPTWWNSIVAAIAVVAAFPAMTAGPAGITLVGVAIFLWLLHRATEKSEGASVFPFALLFMFWSNFDPTAWFGLALLWAAAIGRFLTAGDREGGASGTPASLFRVAAVSTIVSLIHPFHWHVLEAPFVLFGVELPEARPYGAMQPHFRWMLHSISSPQFWTPLDSPVIAGAVLAGLTLITLLLNSRRVSFAHVAIFLAANGLATRAGVLFPAAAVVNAVLAGLYGQAWYARTFRQTYSVAWTELLFSRAGRAITVFGLFALAYLMINGALPGVDGRRLGMGFDWRIKTAVSSYKVLASHTDDDRAFNGRPDHGDLMIWVGMKPFNDSRLALYARGPENLLQLHRDTFRALQVAQPEVKGTGEPTVWKGTFDRFFIKHVYARLTGEDGGAKYNLLQRVMLNPELTLADIDAAAARFDRADLGAGNPAVAAPRLAIDFIGLAFRGPNDAVVGIPGWPRELTTYERWLIQPEPAVPGDGQLAQHLDFLGDELAARLAPAARPGETSHALRVQAIRHARRSLMVDPNTPQVYQLLRGVYRSLLRGEQGFGQFGQLNELRVRQWLAADYFALLTSAATPAQHEELAHILASVGYLDAALEHLQIVFAKTGAWTSSSPTDPNFKPLRDENQALLKRLEQTVKEIQTNANRELQRGEDPIAVAKAAFDAGCPQFALSILAPLEAQIVRDPMASIFHAQLLMAVGRMEEAWERLEGSESLFPPDDAAAPPGAADLKSTWRTNTAIANMVRGDADRAISLWQEEARHLSTASVRASLDNAPLTSTLPIRQDLLGIAAGRVGADALYTFPERWAVVQMQIAVSEIEQGRISNARTAIERILKDTPRASIRPLAAYYHQMLTGEAVSPQPPPAEDVAGQAMFADDGSIVDPKAMMGDPKSPDDTPPPPPVAVPLESPK